MTMNNYQRYLPTLLWLSALALAGWTLWQLPVAEMLSQVGRLGWQDWLVWPAINALILYLAVKRWQLLAQALDTPLPLPYLFRLRQAGSTVSFVTPGPHFGGEPLQLYWLNQHCHLPLHRSVAVLGLDRFLETGVNIGVLLAGVLLLLGTTIMPVAAWLQVSAILATVLVAMLAIAVVILRHPDWLARRFSQLGQRWRDGDNPSERESGWTALVNLLRSSLTHHRPRLWLALLLALAGWVALIGELVMLMGFLGMSPALSEVLLIVVGMRLAMLLPMPGGIGTIEASLLWSFGFLGLPLTVAAGLIALMRLRDAVVLLIGFGCLASLKQEAGEIAEST